MIRSLKQIIGEFVFWFAKAAHIDLLALAHRQIGILREAGAITSEEHFFITHTLAQKVANPQPVYIDGGANIGEYSLLLRETFPQARIIAFEPNPIPFKMLVENTAHANIEVFPLGLSATTEKRTLFGAHQGTSKYGSLYREAITDIHHQQAEGQEVALVSLDDFCKEHRIDHIDLLKLDIEGHELEALRGAQALLKKGAIHAIQFEFNAVNVAARVFLKDFYDLMPNYQFYRMRKTDLLPLGRYNAINEIFRIHNILAIVDDEPLT